MRCLILIGLLVATSFRVSPALAQTRQKIVVAYVAPSDSMVIPGIARDTGILARHGFDADVVLVTGSPRVVQSLIAGSFDYAIPGVTPLIRARIQGADTAILATTTDYSSQRVMVEPRAAIRRLEDLRGKKIGVTQYGSDGDTFLRIVLQKAKLKPDADVQIIQTGGSPQTVAALAAGAIDAGAMGGSTTALAASRIGAQTLITAQELKVLAPSGTLATTRRKIDRSRDEVRRFMQAYVEGIHFFKTHREESLRIMQRYMGGLSLDIVGPLYEEARNVYQPMPYVSEEAVQAMIDREADPKGEEPQAKGFHGFKLPPRDRTKWLGESSLPEGRRSLSAIAKEVFPWPGSDTLRSLPTTGPVWPIFTRTRSG